ncbi:hypothetical protein [Microbacterium sp. NPDC076911]|uniref:hypothetical protein n=1 Tax=Microbacterium sp. NPDC076911 TaxID=3154958 RepID=UPI00342C5D30
MRATRIALITIGILAMIVGGVVFTNDVRPDQYLAIITWLVAALVVHDVLIAGLVFGVVMAGRKAATRVPFASIVIVQVALAVGAIVSLVVIPQIVKDAIGTANPSVLPLNYALNLAVFLLVLTVAATAAVLLHAVLARRLDAQRTEA